MNMPSYSPGGHPFQRFSPSIVCWSRLTPDMISDGVVVIGVWGISGIWSLAIFAFRALAAHFSRALRSV